MPLFDIIKDPERAAEQHHSVLEDEPQEAIVEAEPSTSELQELRADAQATDRRDAGVGESYTMDASAQYFLEMCLARAREASMQPYRYDHDIEDGFDTRGSIRIVAVSALIGDWPHVLSGRESALATVAELQRLGFLSPMHDYRRVNGRWELRLRFAY